MEVLEIPTIKRREANKSTGCNKQKGLVISVNGSCQSAFCCYNKNTSDDQINERKDLFGLTIWDLG